VTVTVKVFGFARSGTHLLAHLIAQNFYRGQESRLQKPVKIGHWLKAYDYPDPVGRLIGGFDKPDPTAGSEPAVYVYRDGRACALSIWRTPYFTAYDQPLAEFLRTPLDWLWYPGRPYALSFLESRTVFEMWHAHVNAWMTELGKRQLFFVRYESLLDDPQGWTQKIGERFDLTPTSKTFMSVKTPVGPTPNDGNRHSYLGYMDMLDLELYDTIVPRDFVGRYEHKHRLIAKHVQRRRK